MADYVDSATASAYIGGASLTGSDTTALAAIITATSRAFDRATERANGFWAAQTAVTRRYSGSGNQWLEIDDWETITAVTMSTTQNRSDATAVTLPIGGIPQAPDYAEVYPLTGPPFSQIFLLRTWYPDAYGIGNVAVTGNTILPPEIADAVAIWVAYRWKRMKADYADRVSIANGPALQWSGVPAEVQQVIAQYKAERPLIIMPRDPRTQSPRLSPLGMPSPVMVPGTLGNS
ncbi:MAG: hypothetical protein LC793_05790 [Thermomicrobia bacterium]|nr:hypothetical protein [Thermomicrobia bacterium]MCA1722769.1 hypothetical protein [Thermomicrobia bacterium]